MSIQRYILRQPINGGAVAAHPAAAKRQYAFVADAAALARLGESHCES